MTDRLLLAAFALYLIAGAAAVLGHIDIGLIAVIVAAGLSFFGVTHDDN